MTIFKDLKVTIINVGTCNRSKVGTTFFIRNGCLEIPPKQNVCIFALGSILPLISAAIIKSEEGKGLLDYECEGFRCPDPLGNVVFKVEEECA